MTQFNELLQSFRDGAATRERVLAFLDGELTAHTTPAHTLLQQLNATHAKQPLPREFHAELVQHISRWLADHTMIRQAPLRAADDETELQVRDAAETEFMPVVERKKPEASAPVRVGPAVKVGSVLLGRFKLMEQVGVGGMSRVYKAIDLRKVEARSPNPYLAVKVLTVAFSDYFGSIAVLHREAHKLQSLTHSNIVRVIDCDRDGQTVFMTMEYLDGISLKATIQAPDFTGMPNPKAVSIIEGIAAALGFAHEKGIVHGDLKPGNIIITSAGEVKVIDFGIARFIAKPKDKTPPPADEWEAPHALTPPYASPEMMEAKQPDPRDDVYALACIAHEVLTGVHPFARESATAARDAGLKAIKHTRLTNRQFRAILGGLEFDREKRTPTVEAFIDQFRGTPEETNSRRTAIVAGVALAIVALGAFLGRHQLARVFTVDAPQTVARTAPPAPGTVFRDCPTCPLMRVLPAGRFDQGAPDTAANTTQFEHPQRTVAIARPFAIGSNEVTIGEFGEFIDATDRAVTGCEVYDGEWQANTELNWRNPGTAQTASHPVTCVSWDDASAYAAWLSAQTQQTYRLPSASEWEYAAGAGATEPWVFDAASACRQANLADETAAQRFPGWTVQVCSDGYTQTAPTGTFVANAFGLRDMLGNVFEWVQDCWYDDYVTAPSDGSARTRTTCSEREARGGSWFTSPQFVRATYRNRFDADHRTSSVGFRVARDISSEH